MRGTMSNVVKIGQTFAAISRFYCFQFGGRAAAILDFQKFNFLTADTLGRPSLRIPAKYYQDWLILCWDMAIFRLFKMAAVRNVEF